MIFSQKQKYQPLFLFIFSSFFHHFFTFQPHLLSSLYNTLINLLASLVKLAEYVQYVRLPQSFPTTNTKMDDMDKINLIFHCQYPQFQLSLPKQLTFFNTPKNQSKKMKLRITQIIATLTLCLICTTPAMAKKMKYEKRGKDYKIVAEFDPDAKSFTTSNGYYIDDNDDEKEYTKYHGWVALILDDGHLEMVDIIDIIPSSHDTYLAFAYTRFPRLQTIPSLYSDKEFILDIDNKTGEPWMTETLKRVYTTAVTKKATTKRRK